MALAVVPPRCPWKGVSLGGWLLLEPGPASPLFDDHPCPESKDTMRCEWTLMEVLRKTKGKDGAADVIRQHRENHISKTDFKKIRARGLNSVRLPFGYWVVLGPSARDPYVGPGLEYIDRAVDWAEECGLQIMLDLHGCPGGESGEAPCGRRRRPDGTWKWRQWRVQESYAAMKIIVDRYKSRKCVTGVSVCNEPSGAIPTSVLCDYYDKSVSLIRKGGMPSSRVAVVLPVFQRNEEEFIAKFQSHTRGRHKNICFDIHCYHCFENEFNGKTLAAQLRKVKENAQWLRQYPIVVGEWSLALGCAAWATCGNMDERTVYQIFGKMQLEAYKNASHGHFFWNWTERDECLEWNFQRAFQEGCMTGKPRGLPRWNRTGEDPLEEELHPARGDARIRFGEAIHIRTFYGRYVDVEKSAVAARWHDKGLWQTLRFAPPAGLPDMDRKLVVSGQVVRLQDSAGRFLCVDPQEPESAVCARRASSDARTEFVVEVENGTILKHRGMMLLRSRATSRHLDADEHEEGLFCRWEETGDWQRFAVEKSTDKLNKELKKVAKNVNAAAVQAVISAKRKRRMSPNTSPSNARRKTR